MILNQTNIRCEQLIIRCLFTRSCCPEDHCQTFLSWTKFLSTPFIHAFCEQYPCKFRKHDTVLTDTFWEEILTSCIIIKEEKLSYFSGNQSLFQAVFHFSAVLLTLWCEKDLLFHSQHASSENLGHSSDSPYQGSLEFYIDSTRMLLSAIHRSLKSFAEHSAHFIFTILHSRKIFMRTGHS